MNDRIELDLEGVTLMPKVLIRRRTFFSEGWSIGSQEDFASSDKK